MYKRGQKVSVYVYHKSAGHSVWINATILGPSEVNIRDVIREAFKVQLNTGEIIEQVPLQNIDEPIIVNQD
jgi:hypothetical protein